MVDQKVSSLEYSGVSCVVCRSMRVSFKPRCNHDVMDLTCNLINMILWLLIHMLVRVVNILD